MLRTIKRLIKSVYLRILNRGLSFGPNTVAYRTTFGQNVRIGSGNTLIKSHIGDYSYTGSNVVVCNATIGKFCSIASDVCVGTGGHPTAQFVSSHPIFYLAKPEFGWNFVGHDLHEEFTPTVVGNDVWLGARVIIRDGVRIGDGAIVGAGAVVVKDLQPYGIYVGMPAKLLRYRFTIEEIRRLDELRWWDKDVAWMRDNAELFENITKLLASLKRP